MQTSLDELTSNFTTLAMTLRENEDEWLLEQLGAELLANMYSTKGTAYRASSMSKADLRKLADRVLKRLERELYSLLCGDGEEDQSDREALGLTRDALIGAIAIALTTGLGVAPAVAAVVAAILLKRGLGPTVNEACNYWNEQLEH